MKNLYVIIAILPVIVLLFVCTTAFAAPGDNPLGKYQMIYGDVTLDGEVSTGDASNLLMYCVGASEFNAMQFINGDVNCDARVNTADAGIILKHMAGMVKELPYSPNQTDSSAEFSFTNRTFPNSGDRLPFGRSYALNGTISSQYALKSVTVRITDLNSGNAEIDKTVTFRTSDKVTYYNTQNSSNAIDNYIKFSMLTTGKKQIKVICSNSVSTDVVVYDAVFRMGFSFDEVADYCYDRSDKASASEARKILLILNSLDFTKDDGAKVIKTGVGYLGKRYSEMDCSKFVQTSVLNALGFKLPRVSVEQAVFCKDNGYLIEMSEMKPGDIIFMSKTDCDCGRYHEVHHSALYIGNYDEIDYIIESASSLNGVVMRRIWGLSSGKWIIDSVARVW